MQDIFLVEQRDCGRPIETPRGLKNRAVLACAVVLPAPLGAKFPSLGISWKLSVTWEVSAERTKKNVQASAMRSVLFKGLLAWIGLISWPF